MPDAYELTLTLRKNGQPVPGYVGQVRRLLVDRAQSFDDALAVNSGAVDLPFGPVVPLTFLILQGTGQQKLVLGDITMTPGSLVLLWDAAPASLIVTNLSLVDADEQALGGG